MMPGGVDHDTVHEDVGLAVTGELVGLGEVAVETVRGIGVQERVDVLHDDGLGVDAAGPDVRELPAVLRHEMLLPARIVLPVCSVLGYPYLRRAVTSQRM